MKIAPKVVFLVRDADGFGPSISDALIPNPSSNLTKSESSPFDISLDKYGIADQKASGDLIQFLDPQGSPQVTVIVIPNYGPPLAACVIREVLLLITAENVSKQPTIILPFVMKAPKFYEEMPGLSSKPEATICGAEIGATTDFTRDMLAETAIISPSLLRINCEPLACLLQMVRVLSLPTVVLIPLGTRSQNKRYPDYETEALHVVGQFLASRIGLCFSTESPA